ncbi:hypothetical protein J2W49_001919 [Hydrogenophaga palleronii]|uniref:Uncharacterized protein n=1 Tax=Hydrogenophaga palleronii TaxID=65655 RepID=A0ABU1WLP6_9BURK|nr:hypothetical protein [Hydrogenophaga palleronii]MDR7149964.1 hypothetical protein [Hydrogenophaga palleronii]
MYNAYTQHAFDVTPSGVPGSGYPEVYRRLMTVGLLGAIYRRMEDADVVNTAVEATLDDPAFYRMCRAIAVGMGGEVGYAREQLGNHVEQNPDDDNAKVAMAVSLMLGGDAEWKSWLDNVMATSTEQSAREAANGVLTFLSALRQAN